MNKARRKQTAECLNRVESIRREIVNILSDEQLAFDSMPEGLQSSMRGMESEEAIGHFEDAISFLDDAITALQEIS
jgi:hypothetical protein